MSRPDILPHASPPRAVRLRRRALFAALWLCLSALLVLSVSSAFAKTKTAPAVSLQAAETFLPTDGTIDFSADVSLAAPVDSMQVRLQILGSSGKIVYQRTQYATDVQAGFSSFAFSRDLSQLHLSPGVYPVRVTVKTSNDTSTDTTSATTDLMLYSPDAKPAEVAVVIRVHGAPLFGPDGTLASDPAGHSDARDAVQTLAELVSAKPEMKLTLAVPPVLLEEWQRLGQGYSVAGQLAVAADDPEAQAYALALAELSSAMRSGRLEVVAEGYADPNLTDLAQHGLSDDIAAQYAAGASAFSASLGTTSSAGSAPASGSLPSSALTTLAEQGVGYVVVGSEFASVDSRPAASGAYTTQGSSVRILVADYSARRALASGETTPTLSKVFERYLAGRTKGPIVICADLGEEEQTDLATVEDFLTTLDAQPWAHLLTGEEAAALVPKGSESVTLKSDSEGEAPADYWTTIESASSYSSALMASLPDGDTDGASALRPLLLAESSAWKGADSKWKRAPEGLAFANASLGISRGILGAIYVRAEPITLAGTQGNVPINIGNNTQKTLKVTVVTRSSGGLGVTEARSFETTLPPQETFVQVPVTMTSSSGKLEVDVMAGGVLIASQTVEVKASYLDRIAIIAMVVGGLIAMLFFIRKKMRFTGDAEETRER